MQTSNINNIPNRYPSTQLPPLLGIWGQLGLDEPTFSCTILRKDGRSIKKFLFFIGFFLPCVVIICSYSCIYWTVRRQRRKLQQHLDYVQQKSTATVATSNGGREREDARLTTMMLIIFLCFLASFLPLMLVNVADEQTRYPWLHIAGSVLAWASSVVNPFVYAASNRTYRVAYYKLFARLKFWGAPLPAISSKSYQQQSRGDSCAANQLQPHQQGAANRMAVNNRLLAAAAVEAGEPLAKTVQLQAIRAQQQQQPTAAAAGENLLMP